MISLADAMAMLYIDTDHSCSNCEGLDEVTKMKCQNSGVYLTGEQIWDLQEYISSLFWKLYNAQAETCENTRGEGLCNLSSALSAERDSKDEIIGQVRLASKRLRELLKAIDNGDI